MPVARPVTVSFVLVVNPQLPVRSVLELVELAKKNPGKLLYASSGAGSAPHLSAELFKTMAGIEITHVPYKGGSPGLNDVIAGHVSLMFADPGPVVPHIRTATVRALGVSSPTRLPGLLDVPPIAEAGVPGFELVSWQMTMAPAGTPKEIVNKLNSELSAIMASPEVSERLAKIGLIATVSPPPEDLNRFLGSEIARWGKLVNQAGLAGSE
jgi:tripartite-type tricarboxylate transporter receptor subunit TctC